MIFSLHKMREVKLLFYTGNFLFYMTDNPGKQQGGVSVTVVTSTHKIHLVILVSCLTRG